MLGKLIRLVMALSVAVITSSCSEEVENYAGSIFEYEFIAGSEGGIVLKGLKKDAKIMGTIKIPAKVKWQDDKVYPVIAIYDGAFYTNNYRIYKNGEIKGIEIPKTVTIIGEKAFKGLSSITSIEIPNSVTEIRSSTFEDCTNLKSVKIPKSVTYIGSNAFENCRSLTSVEIPNSVTEIGSAAFVSCSSLTEVKIPNSVTYIGFGAFGGCRSLTEIKIPKSITEIEGDLFWGCESLTSIKIPKSFIESHMEEIGENTSLDDIKKELRDSYNLESTEIIFY